MNNHSPGPWQIDGEGCLRDADEASIELDRVDIKGFRKPRSEAEWERQKANTALILAAPMMREALKRVMVECGGALSTKTYHFVVLAIGQAEGRS